MKKESNESIIVITYVLVMAIIFGFFALVSYLFEVCWNLGIAKIFDVVQIDFETSTYTVGFISLVGYFFRGWGLNCLGGLGKRNGVENEK